MVTEKYININEVRKCFPKRNEWWHKGKFGHALLIAGSEGKMGAAILAAKACLRTGCGLLTVHIPSGGNIIIQTAIPEAITSVDINNQYISTIPDNQYDATGIGPGIGKNELTQTALYNLLKKGQPLIIDADALNIIAQKNWQALIPANSILTPHKKEFCRLFGPFESEKELYEKQLNASSALKVFIVVKGKNTNITTPDGKRYINPTGNPGMAKGGSGDVLTGIITALVAQGLDEEDAVLAGVYLHGLAADIAIEKINEYSLTATDIIEHISDAINKIMK